MNEWREFSLPLREEKDFAKLVAKIEEFRSEIADDCKTHGDADLVKAKFVTLEADIDDVTEGDLCGRFIKFTLVYRAPDLATDQRYVTGQVQRWLDLAPIANDIWDAFTGKFQIGKERKA